MQELLIRVALDRQEEQVVAASRQVLQVGLHARQLEELIGSL